MTKINYRSFTFNVKGNIDINVKIFFMIEP